MEDNFARGLPTTFRKEENGPAIFIDKNGDQVISKRKDGEFEGYYITYFKDGLMQVSFY